MGYRPELVAVLLVVGDSRGGIAPMPNVQLRGAGTGYVVLVDGEEYAVLDTEAEAADLIHMLSTSWGDPWSTSARRRLLGPLAPRVLSAPSRVGKSVGVGYRLYAAGPLIWVDGGRAVQSCLLEFTPSFGLSRAEVLERIENLRDALFTDPRRGAGSSRPSPDAGGDPVRTDPERSGGEGAVEPGANEERKG